MCNKCVKEERPERERSCLEDGSYLVNYNSCAVCLKKTQITTKDREDNTDIDEDDDFEEQTVTYNHHCATCDHLIAKHYYHFANDGDTQDILMECILCGRGANIVRLTNIIEAIQNRNPTTLEKPKEIQILQNLDNVTSYFHTRLQEISPQADSIALSHIPNDDSEWN